MPDSGNGQQFSPDRKVGRLEHVSALVRDGIRDAAARQGFAVTSLLTGWEEIAGADMARISRPVRIHHDGGSAGSTLVLEVAGAVSQEIRMQTPWLIKRINSSYGYRAIGSIMITQTSRKRPGADTPPPARTPPGPARVRELEEMVADIEDEELRRQLLGLGKSIGGRHG